MMEYAAELKVMDRNPIPALKWTAPYGPPRPLPREVAASPLAGTPYDLRHAAVSTWLNGGVSPTAVAEWAGHSVEVLLKIYAKFLEGTDVVTRQRVQAALGHLPGR